jgi:transposase-like protein
MVRHRARRVRRSAEQWGEIVRRYDSSGLGARAFCRREGLSSSSFERWRRRAGSSAGARFIELVPPRPMADAAREGAEGWSLELSLPNGVSLRWRG